MKKSIAPVSYTEPKTKEMIAAEMNISLRTLQRKLKKVGLEIPRGYIPPDLQDSIYQALGWKALSKSGTN